MKVKELIEELKKLPEDDEVYEIWKFWVWLFIVIEITSIVLCAWLYFNWF